MQNTIYTFPSGLKLAHLENKFIRSVSLGIYFGVGSSNENTDNNGISHFIEHMMFKGTPTRSALAIVEELEGNGINVNAFTSKMMTCYYTVSMDEEAERCFDVLHDIILNSEFNEEEIAKEKGVVLEEISIAEDDPQDVCLEMLAGAYYGEHPMGMTILGSRKNVSGFTRKDILDYYKHNYLSNNCCISVAGNISFEKAKALVEKYFEGQLRSEAEHKWQDEPYSTSQNYVYKIKDVEQANIAIAFPAYSMKQDLEVPTEIISNVLGGGMSSRLFQTIREKLGLAYSVYTYSSPTVNNGYFVVALSTNPSSVEKAIKAVKEQIDEFRKNGMTVEEFNRAKKLIKSGYIVGQESSVALMRVMGKYALCKNRPFSIDELAAKIDGVKYEDMKKYIEEIFDYSRCSMSYVGREIGFNALDRFKA